MKKILIIIGIIALILILGVVIFIATFRLDRYRPLVVNKIESMVGNNVGIGSINLGWRHGVVLELKGFKIFAKNRPEVPPYMEIESIRAEVKWDALFRKAIELGQITIVRPKVSLSQHRDGSFEVLGIAMPEQKNQNQTAGVNLQMLSLLMNKIIIQKGQIHYLNRQLQPPLDLTVREIDVSLGPVSLSQPVEITGKAALFHAYQQNTDFEVKFVIDLVKRQVRFSPSKINMNLSQIDGALLSHEIPALAGIHIDKINRGSLSASLKELVIPFVGRPQVDLDVALDIEKIGLKEPPVMLNQVSALAKVDMVRATLERFSAELGGGNIRSDGFFNYGIEPAEMGFNLRGEGIEAQALFPAAQPNEPHPTGSVDVEFKSGATGKLTSSDQISGEGTIRVQNGTIVNFNIMREIFRRLAIIPGLVETLTARLPENYGSRFEATDTVFKPMELPFTFVKNTIRFDQVAVSTDSFELAGGGSVDLNGPVNGNTIFFLDPDLSSAIIRSVNELEYLTDPKGRLNMPIQIRGNIHKVEAVPDLKYVGTRLAASKAQDALGGLLRKTLEKKGILKETQ